ncbi:CMRF35-like molecule 8 [Colossoma macropomum]|uniref:CMRF35-like molecule 8 n=1 Tax=Colossoma macropomum TaxID=42526 RepID=UPI001863DA24|nr:CMRF35-like molecule 8 [Colossoma macropomum]
MKILLIFTLFLIPVGGGESERVTGYSGGGVLIKCRYDTGYTSNPKYLCKGSWSKCADQIKTGVKNERINKGRFSLFDDTRAAEFWVLIRELTVEDSGTYHCGVDIDWQRDAHREVELNITENQSYKKRISVTGHVGGSVNISCKYPQSHSTDPKFLCRRVGTADCNNTISLNESRRWINEGKLYLHDDGKQIFTVIINSLSEGDSGEYWCGAESDWTSDHGYKVYITQINLRVTATSSSSSTPQSTETISSTASTTSPSFRTSTAFPASSVVTGMSVILVLLLVGLLFFIVTLKKRSKTQDPGRTQSQPFRGFSAVHRVSDALYDYEEINDIRHLPSSDTRASTVYSTAQLPTNPSEPPQTVITDNVQLPSSCDFSNPIYSPAQSPSNSPDQDIYSTAELPTIPSDSSASATQHSAGKSAEGPTYTTVNLSKKTERSTDTVARAAFNREDDSCDYDTVKC